MSDLLLSEATGDLDLTNDELSIVDGVDAIAQHLKLRFQFAKGEWFLDQRIGVPYFESILLKNPDLVAVRAIFRQVITETPGIDSILDFDMTIGTSTRTLSLTFTVLTDTGEELVFDQEFIIG